MKLRGCLLLVASLWLGGCGTSGSAPDRAAAGSRPAVATRSATAEQLARDRWSLVPAAPIPPRESASVIWTGRELVVWGGASASDQDLRDDGATYDPDTRRWRILPPAPISARFGQATVWTGTEMIVWGGYDSVSRDRFKVSDDGAAYNPSTNSWTLLPQAPLSGRSYAIPVWTGSRLFILGGQPAVTTNDVKGYRDGAVYDPADNRWRHLVAPTPPHGHPLSWRAAVQADGELLAWSEWASSRRLGPGSFTGGVDLFGYDESTERWRLIPGTPGLPDVEEAVWTGDSVVVRGSTYNCGDCPGPFVPEATDLYHPGNNTWTRLPADPLGGDDLLSAWTGAALFSFNAAGIYGSIGPGAASAYDPATKRWTRLRRAPTGCDTEQPPIWTGRELLMYCARSGRGARVSSGLALTPGRA
jgi:hypothetical protein